MPLRQEGSAGAGACLLTLLLLGLTLPVWITWPSKHSGAGEMEIVSGFRNGTRLLAPTYVNAGQPIDAESAEARVVHIGRLCDAVLECDRCPPQMKSSFDAGGGIFYEHPEANPISWRVTLNDRRDL